MRDTGQSIRREESLPTSACFRYLCRMPVRALILAVAVGLSGACGNDAGGAGSDGGPGGSDASGRDAGPQVDAGPGRDGGPGVDGGGLDSGSPIEADAGPPPDCAAPSVRCVDDTPGPMQEYATIQAAADATGPGDIVLVASGRYAGFQVDTSGTASARITYRTSAPDVVIDSPAGTGDGIRLQNVSYVTLEGFRIEDPPQRCIAARGASPTSPMVDLVIRRNICRNSTVEGFYLSEVSMSLVEGNDISGTGVTGDTRSHGIYLANAGSDGTTIRGNLIANAMSSESNGIHVNGDLSVGGDGITSGLVIEQNLIHDNAQNGINLDGVQDSTIRNNVIWGNARNAIRAYAIDGAAGPRSLRIVSNTLVTTAAGGWAVKLTEDLGEEVVFDNILLSGNSLTGAICVEDASRIRSANNVGVNRFSADDESSIISLTAWQALGLGTGSRVATPAELFVDAAGADFHLRIGAPAIDRGVATFASVAAPAVDYEGTARPTGAAYDVGADER